MLNVVQAKKIIQRSDFKWLQNIKKNIKQNHHIIQKDMFHVQVKVKRSITRLILQIPPPLFSHD